jgi:plasmid stabilization system protein ParE
VAAIRLLSGALADLERLADILRETGPDEATKTIEVIYNAIRVLAEHPLIGRTVDPPTRELLIFRGRSGYIAQYRYEAPDDTVFITGIRHQREFDG